MKVRSTNLGISVAIAAALVWSFYCVGDIGFRFLMAFLFDGGNLFNGNNFNWTEYLNKYLGQLTLISFGSGLTGWLVGEIYNDLNEVFETGLK
jgi:hypothetical protein